MRRMMLAGWLMVLAAVLIAACDDDVEPGETPAPTPAVTPTPTPTPTLTPTPPATPTPSPAPTGEETLDERCENEVDGYAVSYPGDWHVNEGVTTARCRFFDPEPFEVPEATEFIRAINIFVEPTRDEAILQGLRSQEVVLDETAMVDGHAGHRIEVRLTRDLLLPEGTVGYHYVIELDADRTLHASTYDLGEHDYGAMRALLDRMMETLEFVEDDDGDETGG